MKNKTVKGRRQYKCGRCNGIIRKGELHKYHTGKFPTYDENDIQDGIVYLNDRTHIDDMCDGVLKYAPNPKERLKKCSKGDHVFEEGNELDHYAGYHRVFAPTGDFHCINCGVNK